MKHLTLSVVAIVIACAHSTTPPSSTQPPLGQFSVSLAVKDLHASRTFYESLGCVAEDYRGPLPKYGDSWLILRNGEAVIGLFHGLFDNNALTFNPPDVRA